MDFEPLNPQEQSKLESMMGRTVDPLEWHIHPNGGGYVHNRSSCEDSVWIADTVIVSAGCLKDDVRVTEQARIYGDVRISGNVQITDEARIYGQVRIFEHAVVSGKSHVFGAAWVYGSAQIQDKAQVSGNAQIKDHAIVCGDSQVCGRTQVLGDASIGGKAVLREGVVRSGEWTSQPLCLLGSIFPVTNSGPGEITVGCHSHSYLWWLENGEQLAKRLGWSREQVQEYKALIFFVMEHGVASSPEASPRKGDHHEVKGSSKNHHG